MKLLPIFADTSFFVALLNPRDALAASARQAALKYPVPVVTTEFVLIEVANFFSRPTSRDGYAEFVSKLQTDPQTKIVSASSALSKRGLSLFANRPDKEWSLTDCISFEVMAEFGLTDALTADHHFEQAGFRALLL